MPETFGNTLTWPSGPPAVPTSTPMPQAASSGFDELIKNIATPIDPNLIKAATTPVAGMHQAQVPTSLQTPVQQHQDAPLDHREVVGRGNARAQGIGNAIIGATNALGKIVNAEAQQKQDHLKDAATKVIMAQQGIDEATQAHEAALANGDATAASKAQELIQKNTQARNDVFADAKIRKALVKGFNISYTDPTANDTEEHKAVMAAMRQAKTQQEKKELLAQAKKKQLDAQRAAGAAAGDAFAKGAPQGVGQNTAAVQQLQLQLEAKKQQQETLKNVLGFKEAMARNQTTLDAAKIRTMGSAFLQSERFQQQQTMLNQRFAQQQKMFDEGTRRMFALQAQRTKDARETAMDIYVGKESDPLTLYRKNLLAADKYNQNYIADQSDLTKAIAARDQAFPKGADSSAARNNPAQYQAFNQQINMLEQQAKLSKQQSDSYTNMANQLHQNFGLGAGSDGNPGSTDQSDAAGSGSIFTDPSAWIAGAGASSNEDGGESPEE